MLCSSCLLSVFPCFLHDTLQEKRDLGPLQSSGEDTCVGELVQLLSAGRYVMVGPLQRGPEVLGGRRGQQHWEDRARRWRDSGRGAGVVGTEPGQWACVAKAVTVCG